ncbi:hypothetical protein O3G_MSEX008121 [Manduca sexta]|uniref:Uncharacterized protein n=1 Tax=Manduca sexta TaxID=7130 RepID=A0A922CPS8_MANSE|nr:hypothetical protein O3G_MSEX008121 [Manduca sexta]KAG6453379.1 hypothetical protein O3G_MSEX008121 [Manduca sexta]
MKIYQFLTRFWSREFTFQYSHIVVTTEHDNCATLTPIYKSRYTYKTILIEFRLYRYYNRYPELHG